MKKLEKYLNIGWDFDDTLIDHPNSVKMWDFIDHNPYGQKHHLITFRSGGLENRIFGDLAVRGSILIESHFENVFNIDHQVWIDFQTIEPKLILSLDDLKDDPYLNWKGEICYAHGIEVLIDDMTFNVLPGCQRHGIDYIHPNDLLDDSQ